MTRYLKSRWILLLLGLAAACAGVALVLARREASAPTRAPGRTMSLPAATPVEIPKPPPSAVESLRAKTHAGEDRFVVEAADEVIEPRLDLLRRAFLDPPGDEGRKAALELCAKLFVPAGFSPAEETPILSSPGLTVQRGEYSNPPIEAPLPPPLADGRRLTMEIERFIAPAKRCETAAFKVLEIQGTPESGRLTSTVHFELLASLEGGERRQWTGTAELGWEKERDAWRLSAWTTKESVSASLRSTPFEDMTEASLGSNASYSSLLAAGLDDFRDRLDAATGIDVYGHHGLAVGDADGDGRDDLYLSMPPGIPNQLLLGREGGVFVDASASSGADALDGTYQALFLDLDNDGDCDLFLVTETGILVLKNDGRGRFSEFPTGLPEMSASRSTPISAAAADYDRDGFLDVYVCAYVFWRGSAGEVGSRLPFPYHEAHNGAPNFLLRGKGDGSFEDVTEKSGLNADNNRFSFAASWADYDSDGDADLFVANDFGSKNLYRNNGDGTFTEVTRQAGVEDTGAGMSVAWEDVDNDGDLDLYTGNMLSSAGRRVTGTPDYKAANPALQRIYRRHARGNSLLENRGDGTFEDVSEPTRAYFGRWAWASGFVDFNLDGREDIFVQNGFLSNAKKDDL